MPVDQVLSFHSVGFHRYELSCLRTRSVRDQILRGELLVERLVARGPIGPGRELLVVGGGAAGLTCALAACARGVDVTMLERESSPLTRQLGVYTRRLDPTEFDWPQPHWRDGVMAPAGIYALHYATDTAANLALAWTKTLNDVVTGVTPLPGALTIYWGVNARALPLRYRKMRNSGFVGLSPWPTPGNPNGTKPFGAVISCIGFSAEKTAITSKGGTLIGAAFWSTDDLDLPDLGVNARRGATVRALVSGGGDGAQQDFLRMLTGTFGVTLANKLGLPAYARQWPRLADALLAEDAALRALSVAAPGASPPVAYDRWHRAYERMAGSIWRAWSKAGAVTGLASAVLKPNVEVTWLVGGAVPGYCYGLNRLLVCLVGRLHAYAARRAYRDTADSVNRKGAVPVVVTHGHAVRVVPSHPASHACGTGCYGHEHLLIVSADPSNFVQLGPFDVIIPRHGIVQSPLIGSPPVHEQRVAFERPY